MKKEILIDLRVLAALVSMLARETLSLESPVFSSIFFNFCQIACAPLCVAIGPIFYIFTFFVRKV